MNQVSVKLTKINWLCSQFKNVCFRLWN